MSPHPNAPDPPPEAHAEKGALIERVAQKEAQNSKNRKAIVAIRADTEKLKKEAAQLRQRLGQ